MNPLFHCVRLDGQIASNTLVVFWLFFTCASARIAEGFKSAFRCQDAVALKMELLFYERICYVQEGSNSLVHHPHTHLHKVSNEEGDCCTVHAAFKVTCTYFKRRKEISAYSLVVTFKVRHYSHVRT